MQNCIKCKKALPDGAVFCCWCGISQTAEIKKSAPRKRGNGQGSVFKMKNGTWRAQYIKGYIPVDGKIKRITKTKSGFKTKTEALKYLELLKNDTSRSTKRIFELYDIISERELGDLSKDKQSHYRTAYKRIFEIADMQISDLTLEDLQAVVDSLDTGFYPKRDVKLLLNKLYEYAVINDYCSKNLAQYIKLPKLEKGEKVTFNEQEIEKLWDSWHKGLEIAGYILIMIHTGIRTGELRNIRTESVDLANRTMYGGIKTEKGKRRPILIVNKIKPIVEYFVSKSNDKLCDLSEYMLYKLYNEMKAELGFREEVFPNCSRHTCATALAAANVPPAVIMEILGHEKYDTSLNYTHMKIETLLESLERAV